MPNEVYRLTGGLCNRLRQMFGLLDVHRSIQVAWPITDQCPGHFLDLFLPIPGVEFVTDRPPTQSMDNSLNFGAILEGYGHPLIH